MGILSILEKDADNEVINDTERILRTHYSAEAKDLIKQIFIS